ncbi:MAG: DUF1848 domain-containing protein [Desulfococcaceae bacterium]
MIVSASRRTDLPAFFGPWFAGRVREGFCRAPNPFNPRQVSRISLLPEDVDAVVFWTRHPRSLAPHLSVLDERGIPYLFLFTLLDYPGFLEPGAPPFARRLDAFRALSDRLGPNRVIWRYDPVVVGNRIGPDFHRETFARIAGSLAGRTRRCIVSWMDAYPKVRRRLAPLEKRGLIFEDWDPFRHGPLMADLARIGAEHGIRLQSCAEAADWRSYGIPPGACVDGTLLERLFGVANPGRKDAGQRSRCRCAPSRDIGMYDTCGFGCRYCYATRDSETAARRRNAHRPADSSLLPLAAS